MHKHPSWWERYFWHITGGILLLTAFSYVRILSNALVWDDFRFIYEWQTPHHLSWQSLIALFGGDAPFEHSGVYRPIRGLFYALSWFLWGGQPFFYHLQALLSHLLATLVVIWVGRLLGKDTRIGLLAGVLFGVHPIHVEPVAWATASFDTIGAVLCILAFGLFVAKRYRLSFFLAVISFFTYEMTLVLPLWITLYLWLFGRLTQLKKVVPYFGAALAYWLIRTLLLNIISRHSYPFDTLLPTMLFMIRAIPLYARLLIAPIRLSVNYHLGPGVNAFFWADHNSSVLLPPPSLFIAFLSLCFLGFIVGFIWYFHSKNPVISWSLGWFLISLLPVMQVFPQSCLFSDKYLYLGSVGFCVGLSQLLVSYAKKPWMGVLVVILIGTYSFLTFNRTLVWKDNIRLWTDTVKTNPTSSSAFTNLGQAYYTAQDLVTAKTHFLTAAILFPHPINFTNLGQIAAQEGKGEEAYTYYQLALNHGYGYPAAHLYLGVWYHQRQRLNEAAESYHTALTYRPDYPEAYLYLGMIAQEQNELEKARLLYLKAIELKRDYADAYNNLGTLYEAQGKWEEAREAYRRALFFNPAHSFAQDHLDSLTVTTR